MIGADPTCDCNGAKHPPPMGGMLDQPCTICRPRAWAKWDRDPYGYLARHVVVRKNAACAALDALTDAERAEVMRLYSGLDRVAR